MRRIRIMMSLVAALAVISVSNPANAGESPDSSEPEIGIFALPQCRTNQFCMWDQSNHTGKLVEKGGTGVSRALTMPVLSLWNNRPYAAKLYNKSGNAFMCIAPGKKLSTVDKSYQNPSSVWLAAGTSC